MTNKQSDSTAAILEVLQKHHMGAIPHDEFISMWFPHLVDAMTEFAALESAKEAQKFDQWKLDNGWKSTSVYIKKYYKRMGKNLIRMDFAELYEEFKRYKEGKG